MAKVKGNGIIFSWIYSIY